MKTIQQVKSLIEDNLHVLRTNQRSKNEEDSELFNSKLKKRQVKSKAILPSLRLALKYLETNPSEEIINQQILEVEAKINTRIQVFELWWTDHNNFRTKKR